MTAALSSPPFLSVLIPVRNEEAHLAACLDSILANPYPADRLEIIIADGQSTDRTREIASSFAKRHPGIRLVDNPGRNQACGVNRAAAASSPEACYLLRLDAHALYPDHFFEQAVMTAVTSGANAIVYVNEPRGHTCFQRAVAAALSHPLGIGGASYRRGRHSGPVDHGQHGCFRRELFLRLGGYDETMAPNEDGELSFRIRQTGETIFLDHQLRMTYFPRKTAGSLFRQYYRYGIARCRNLCKHRTVPKFRQLAPPLLVLAQLVTIAGAWRFPALLCLPAGYAFVVAAATLQLAWRERSCCPLWCVVVFPVLHHAWGIGFLRNALAGGRVKAA